MSDKTRKMRLDLIRLLQSIVLVLFETTLVFLVGAILTSIGDSSTLRWWIVLVVVGASSLVTAWLEPINADASHIRPQTAIIAAVVVGWSVAWHIRAQGGGIALLGTLTDPDDPRFLVGYTALIAGVVAWLRGGQLLDIGHPEMVQRFRRGIVAVMVALAIITVAGFGQGLTPQVSRTSVNIPAWIIVLLLLGLVSLSVTRITTVGGDGGRAAQWLWLRSSLLSSMAIVLGGLLALSLVAAPAGILLREAASLILYAFALALSPIAWLVFTVVEFLRATFVPDTILPPPPMTGPTAVPDQVDPQAALAVPEGLLAITTLLLMLLPVVVLLLLIFFATRRRPAPATNSSEQRESIFSWSGLGSDISNLLGALRRPRGGEGGLAGVLRRLVAEDPVTRIRRRYIQLLLQGEAADKRRRVDETPREFVHTLGDITTSRESLHTLTATYEQARYAPDSVDQATAERADQAWQELSNDVKRPT